jgi:NADPH2:quinone reductase
MAKAIRLHQTGGAEVLSLENVEVGAPGPGQARVRHSFVAVNFIDIYFRTGRYPMPLPNGLGSDAVGVVEAVGEGVTDIQPGDRVGYLLGPQGAYSDVRVMPAEVLIPLPEGVSDRTASALMMKGMTAQYLFRQVFPLQGGETILYHAAAGGVGLIACQWAHSLGATVIGTVGSAGKALIARAHGCDHVINIREEDLVAKVKDYTKGKGVDVVYDSIGKETFPASLDCLKPLGTWVSFGQSSGPVPEFKITLLSQKGSLFATRPSLNDYTRSRKDLVATANDLFEVIGACKVKIAVNQTYPLVDAARAHHDLESRLTTGSTVLLT